MKRTLSFGISAQSSLILAGTCLIAGTYGLVRLAYGLFLPDIATSLQMSTATSGLISSGASIAYCLGALIGLTAGRRARLIVMAAVGTAAIGSIGMAMAPGVLTLGPAAILSSMGAGLASPAMVTIIERNVIAKRVDKAQAVVNAGTGPGLVAAGALALIMLPNWRLGFLISAFFTVAAGLVVLVLDRRPSWPACDESPEVVGAGPRYGTLLVPAVGSALLGGGSTVVWTYGRTQLIEQGAGETASTIAWVMLGLGGAAAILTASHLARLTPARAWQISVIGVTISTAMLAVSDDQLWVALAACILFGWGFVAATSALITWASRLVTGHAAAGTSILFVILVFGQALGASAAAAISGQFGLSAAFYFAAGMTLLAAACGAWKASNVPTRNSLDLPRSERTVFKR